MILALDENFLEMYQRKKFTKEVPLKKKKPVICTWHTDEHV